VHPLPQDPAALAPGFEALGLGGPYTPIAEALAELVAGFMRHEPLLLAEYLAGRQPAQAVAQAFIRGLGRQAPRLDPKLFLRFLEQHDQASDQWIRARLAARGFQQELSVLGFGLGDGSYERALCRWLVHEARLAASVRLWGFDTHPTAGGEVRMLTRSELEGAEAPRFDVIIARYVLHHIEPRERWSGFLACLRRCRPGATVLIAEQGYPAPSRPEHTPEARSRELLLVSMDVLANATLYPGWCGTGGADFFVSFLSEEELDSLERQFPPVTQRELCDVGPAFPGNVMFRYELAGAPEPPVRAGAAGSPGPGAST
jgi:hypothetical protein